MSTNDGVSEEGFESHLKPCCQPGICVAPDNDQSLHETTIPWGL